MEIFSIYNRHWEPGITFTQETMTQQNHKDDCDVNRIIERFTKTGTIPQIISGFEFADVSDVPSYQEALDFLNEAQERFMELPAKIRKEFDNDPGTLLRFLDDPNNYARAVELGLVEKEHVSEMPFTHNPLDEAGISPQGNSSGGDAERP
jgi:phage internal scaffolding protein